jgi:indole-3-glycerol phosphate synthase
VILDDIVAAKRVEVAEHKASRTVAALRASRFYAEPRRGFHEALRRPGRAVIAEVKKASPSRGVIRADFAPVEIAKSYERAGARCLSVLTDEPFFQGSLAHLGAIRHGVGLPLLRKDFVIDPYQVVEARAFGADAVLLICAILGDGQLRELHAAATEAGLDALVEVHDEPELERALACGARLVGINNRDLRSFVTSLEVAETLAPRLPAEVTAVAESGLKSAADLERLERAGVHAYLIGESLMTAADPGEALAALLH